MHVLWEVASAILVIIPLFAVGQAYRQTRSPRLLFAFLAFAVLELRFGVAVAIHSVIVVDHTFEETVGFLTDLIAIALFAAAFLYATWWLRIAAAASRGGFRLAHSRRTTEL